MTKRYPKVVAKNENIEGWPVSGTENREKRRPKPLAKGVIMNDIQGNPIQPKTHGQHELVKAIDEFDIIFINGPAGTGKAQPLDAKILTPDGWELMGNIKIGDLVISHNGAPTKVTGVFPQGLKDVYNLKFSDGASAEACDEHLWECQNTYERTESKAHNIRNTEYIRNNLHTRNGTRRYNISIPLLTSPVQFNAHKLPIDPYVMGLLLGDGCFRGSYPSFASVDASIIEYVSNYAKTLGIELTKGSRKCNYRLCTPRISGRKSPVNPLKVALDELGLWGHTSLDKFIPIMYKQASISDRISLLQGLMDSDGTIENSGSMNLSTSSNALKSDFIELINSLGGVCNVRSKIGRYRKSDGVVKACNKNYTVTLNIPDNITPFNLTRKADKLVKRTRYTPTRYVESVEYVGKKECQCIMVDDVRHLYITNDYILTHNTFLSTIKAIDYIENKPESPIKKLIITRPAVEAGENLGFMPGDLKEKFDHYMAPIYDAIAKVKRKAKPQSPLAGHNSGHNTGAAAAQVAQKPQHTSFYSLEEYGDFGKKVHVTPMAFMRGTNFENAFVILDEAQNLTKTQMKLFLTRMCEGSKLIICGDVSQTDLKTLSSSGFAHAQTLLAGVEGVGVVNMTYNDIVRHKLVKDILIKYDKESYRDHVISNQDD